MPSKKSKPSRASSKSSHKTTSKSTSLPSIWIKRILKWGLIFGFFGGLAGASFVAGLFYFYSKDLPKVLHRKDFKPPQMTRIYARNGEVIAKLARPGGGKRTVVPMDKIPLHVRHAFMAAEDADFMTHSGIDLLSMTRAFYYAIFYDTGLKGTSTITQQVVKNLILTPDRKLKRKLQEIMLARELEKNLTKEDILWLYLNELYMGHGINGVEEAALLYFGKHIEDVSLEEGAVMAGITQSPERHSPIKHPKNAKKRRSYVLKQLWQKGFIKEADYRRADASELIIKSGKKTQPHLGSAPFFVEHVRKILIKKYGEEKTYTGGLRVHTTLDISKQQGAVHAVSARMADYDQRKGYYRPKRKLDEAKSKAYIAKQDKVYASGKITTKHTHDAIITLVDAKHERVTLQLGPIKGVLLLEPRARILGEAGKEKQLQEVFKKGHIVRVVSRGQREDGTYKFAFETGPEVGMVLIEPHSRDVLALVGGYDFHVNKYNHVTQAKRQTGSTFKPIVYAAALEKKIITPATIYQDSPATFKLPGSKVYSPKNSDGSWRGPIRIREALGASRNVVAVKVLKDVGVDTAVEFAKRIGIESTLSKNLTMVMGSSSLTLLEASNAYATFASGGQLATPRFITHIESIHGEVERFEVRPTPVLSAEVAFVITELMQSVVAGYTSSNGTRRQGTGSAVKKLGHPVAGKTGTTNKARDALFIGFTPYYVAGVWVGFDDNSSLGSKEYGGRVAAPIWLEAMKAAHKGLKIKPFTAPPMGITTVAIDPKSGLLVREQGIKETFLTGTAPTEYVPQGESTHSFLLNQFP